MAINRVDFNNRTLIDIGDTTAEAADVAAGKKFYTKSGEAATGSGNYMDKVSSPTSGDLLTTDANGQAVDAGVSVDDLRDVFVATRNVTTYADLLAAYNARKCVLFRLSNAAKKTQIATVEIGTDVINLYVVSSAKNLAKWEVDANNTWTKTIDVSLVGRDDLATDTAVGVIKTNPDKAIDLNADGQLEVGGRLGQFPTTTGIYAPNNREPRAVGDYSMLVTDALGMNMAANRSMAVVSGYGLACKSAAAGATEYHVTNNYANRILCKLAEGGFASRDEATSKVEQIVQVVSVTINGASYTPDSAANDTTNDIVITTSETLNPDSAITNIRLFGTMASYATIHTGNGIKSEGGGRNILLGGGVTKAGGSNDNALVGNGIYSSGNGNAAFGRHHICRKNRGFFAGTGHDSTNAPSEGASAVGQYSYMDANTLFAVGNGTSHTDRKNAFEVRTDGIVLRSPNGTRYKLAVDDSGNITTTAL